MINIITLILVLAGAVCGIGTMIAAFVGIQALRKSKIHPFSDIFLQDNEVMLKEEEEARRAASRVHA